MSVPFGTCCQEKRHLKKLSLLGIYHLLSNYGESYKCPTLFAAIIVSLSTIFPYVRNVDFVLKHPLNVHILEDAFKESVLSFFPYRHQRIGLLLSQNCWVDFHWGYCLLQRDVNSNEGLDIKHLVSILIIL